MNYLRILQIIISIALILAILLQNRGTGLSGIFGGSSNVYMSKRGLEKKLFIATIVFGALFLVISFLSVIMK